MPTVIIEGPQLSSEDKKGLIQKLTPIVSYIYDWKVKGVTRGSIFLSEWNKRF